MPNATEKDADELLGKLVKTLKGAVEADDCPAATLNVARQLLKDNGVTFDPTGRPADFNELRDSVTSQDEALPDLSNLPTDLPH